MISPTERFSDRVDAYTRYRPGYPPEVIDRLTREVGLGPAGSVADLGSGTGIWTELLLARGARVFAVEPNANMRAEAERRLDGRAGFTSVAGSAEATTLPSSSVELATAAQAFHWFDRASTRRELARILRPDGVVALVWNTRKTTGDAFLEGYERLLTDFAVDYPEVDHRSAERDVESFFGSPPGRASFPNHQELDYAGLEGRLRSTSYVVPPGHERWPEMAKALGLLFERHARDGRVRIEYDVLLFWGTL